MPKFPQFRSRRSFVHQLATTMAAAALVTPTFSQSTSPRGSFKLVIHGGAGGLPRNKQSPADYEIYLSQLRTALLAGYRILNDGGKALDAIEAAIVVLEDSPLYNAGKGAVLTSAGQAELDASIMDGSNLKAGAVASVKRIRNPIKAARLVMDKTRHLLFVGNGADELANEHGLEMVPNDYFITAERRQEWLEKKQQKSSANVPEDSLKFGTVGAVALDMFDNLAAGTSTGGLAFKMSGRVGDSPIIGAGTIADNSSCAVSCTGDGEFFIRAGVARDISALITYKKMSLEKAAATALKKAETLGGKGGLIALDRKGRVATPYNTPGLHRGIIDQEGKPWVAIL